MAALDELKVKTGELLDEGARTGLLTPEELAWRRGHLARAETVEALEVLVEDLLAPEPTPGITAVSLPRASQMTILSSRTFSLADLGLRSELVTIMGSSRVDLGALAGTEALTIELVTIMGDTVVEVPAGLKVRVEATPIMGDSHVDPSISDPSAPVRITGVVVMGSLRVVKAKAR